MGQPTEHSQTKQLANTCRRKNCFTDKYTDRQTDGRTDRERKVEMTHENSTPVGKKTTSKEKNSGPITLKSSDQEKRRRETRKCGEEGSGKHECLPRKQTNMIIRNHKTPRSTHWWCRTLAYREEENDCHGGQQLPEEERTDKCDIVGTSIPSNVTLQRHTECNKTR